VFTAVFIAVNFLGAKSAAAIEVGFVTVLLVVLIGLVVKGVPNITPARFRPFVTGDWNALVSTVGFVFVSFGGLVKVTSIAGEVKRPASSIPLGMIGSVIVVTALYVLSLVVVVGVLDGDTLSGSIAPLADTARVLVGSWGFVVLTVAAAIAFVTTAHAGILSASRYPYALAQDQLLPGFLGKTTQRAGVPVFSLLLTGILVGVGSVVPLKTLISAASTIILSSYLLSNVGALVMRYSKLTSYRPTFRVPFSPYVQAFAIAIFLFFIIDLGWTGVIVAASLAVLSMAIYLLYGRRRHAGEYALLHLVERITNRKIAGDGLERELREIVHEKDEVVLDNVDQVFNRAAVLDVAATDLKGLFSEAAQALGPVLDIKAKDLETSLQQREKESGTAISDFVAVPHLIVDLTNCFSLLCVRSKNGVVFNERFTSVKAIFVLAGSADKRTLHLQTLAALAQIAMDSRFEKEWLNARGPEQLREVLLLGERRRIGGD
jgi:mannitol/fructose-specific phosphotransferase system IIA component (Ntr-type)